MEVPALTIFFVVLNTILALGTLAAVLFVLFFLIKKVRTK